MTSNRQIRRGILAAATVLAMAGPAFALSTQPQAPLLSRPMHQGAIAYISGGIGRNEQRALEASAKSYNLAITNANRQGDFTADTHLVIERKSGRNILDVKDTGPLFYAKLPSGRYVIHASNAGVNIVRHVRISANHAAEVHLIWPQMG